MQPGLKVQESHTLLLSRPGRSGQDAQGPAGFNGRGTAWHCIIAANRPSQPWGRADAERLTDPEKGAVGSEIEPGDPSRGFLVPFQKKGHSQIIKEMQNDWRFTDRPLKGHWRYLPDDLSLQRGATIVILPDGRRLRVPAMSKRDVHAPGNKHDGEDGENMLKSLQALLAGKHGGPKTQSGFKAQGRQRRGAAPAHRLDLPTGRSRVEAGDMPRPVVAGGAIQAEM